MGKSKMIESTGSLMSPDEVACRWSVTKAAIYRWVEQDRLQAVRVGSLLRFREEDLAAFLADCGR